MLALEQSSGTAYYETDGIGSITSLTSSAGGSLAENYTYDSFGNLKSSGGSVTNSFRYAGREFDAATGLYYYRARYYDPVIGRFLSEDPIGFGGGMNFYAYVNNDPIELVDPSGLAAGDAGGWTANLNDPQIAPLVHSPWPSSSHYFGVNEQCVSLTRALTGLPCTDCWRAGPKVIGNKIPDGTAIATFDANGRYPQTGNHGKNSGIYVGQNPYGPSNEIFILDQWPGHLPKTRPLDPDPTYGPSNDSQAYYVITVPPGTKSAKCKCGNW